ncbi:MAG: pseudouridine synthase [Sutterella sp.]
MFDAIVPLDVLYEDDVLGIVSKPAKMLVHRTEIANGDTVFAVQCARETFGRRVWPVHRLDRGTSGVLVFAFDQETAGALGRQMMADGMKKRYAAVVRGTIGSPVLVRHPLVPPEDPYLRHSKKEAQEAATVFFPAASAEVPVPSGRYPTTRLSLVTAELLTGRRHQIRRHLKWLAHPIIGDATYGKGPLNRALAAHFGVERLMLHCVRMAFSHPATGELIDVAAPPEADYAAVLDTLGWRAAYDEKAGRPWEALPAEIETLV